MNTRTSLFEILDTHKFLKFNSPWWNSWELIATAPETNYPPYDVEKDGDNTILTFAVAGFKKEDLSVSHIKRDKKLKVSGTIDSNVKQRDCGCNHTPCSCIKKQGIARRPFNIEFGIEDAKVASVKLEDGLLTVVVKPVDPPKDEVETIEIQ